MKTAFVATGALLVAASMIVPGDRHAQVPTNRSIAVQSVPPAGSPPVSGCAACAFFLNRPVEGKLSYSVHAGDADITSRTMLLTVKSAQGNPIVVLAPLTPFPPDSLIRAEIRVADPDGEVTHSLEFRTGPAPPAAALARYGFEENNASLSAQGDFSASLALGVLVPREGARMGVLSTGSMLGGEAVTETTSLLSMGPFSVPGASGDDRQVTLQYDFLSAEFDQYVGTQFDDAFLVILSGPQGAQARLVTSVNAVGREASVPPTGEVLPQGAMEHTDWRTFTLRARVGRTACLTFILTDVGDAALESVVALDSIALQ